MGTSIRDKNLGAIDFFIKMPVQTHVVMFYMNILGKMKQGILIPEMNFSFSSKEPELHIQILI